MSLEIGQITLGIYAVMLLIGGLVGFLKAGSSASLIAGGLSSLMIGICFGFSFIPAVDGFAFVVAGVTGMFLAIFFSRRFLATGKVMPGGMMAILSIAATVIFFWAGALTI